MSKINTQVFGDIHCSDIWKKYIDLSCDKIVFLGDYVDSYIYSNEQMINNLKDIIQFKLDNLDKVVLLYGNHEFNYLYPHTNEFKCSGLRPEIQYDIYDILHPNKNLFQNAYQIEDVIFTHAGIQHNWFVERYKGDIDKNIADQLNKPKDKWQEITLHDVGYLRGGMRCNVGGIFWCDRQELKKPLQGFKQIVGHTPVDKPKQHTTKNAEVLFCDCLEKHGPIKIEI